MDGIIEVWQDIPSYKGLYQVSNLGRVKSLYNYKRNGSSILTPHLKRGYYTVGLRRNGVRKWHLIHRLVADVFIPNKENKPQVNHKDENKLNNNVDNLEWCTASYNNNYGSRLVKVADKNKLRRQVYMYDLKGNLVDSFKSVKEASIKTPYCMSSISNYCRNITKCKDYIFTYKGGGLR